MPGSPETLSSAPCRSRCGDGSKEGQGRCGAKMSLFLWPCVARALVLTLMVLSCVGVSVARPAAMTDVERNYRNLQSRAVKYLSQFGYLTGPSRETGNLMSADDFSKAIKALQANGGLPQTGVIDRRTEELMSRPRCGNVDSMMGVTQGQGRSDLGKAHTTKWDKTDITFRIQRYTQDMPMQSVREAIHEAFSLWSNVTQLQFIEVMHGNADIMIQFASRYHQDGYPFDGKGMILAHAFFPGAGKGGDTHFDDDETWTRNSSDGVNLFTVAAHQFGHALGLPHSADAKDLMNPLYQEHGKFILPRESIQEMYGLPQADKEFQVPLISKVEDEEETPRPHGGYDVNPTPADSDEQPPDPCTTPFDAITVIRSEVFFFIGKWFWRVDSNNNVKDPVHIHKFWYGLPPDVTKIDAALERPGDKRILFFAGDRYWIYNANRMVTGFPREGRPITEFGIPADVKHIDAVFTWGMNKRTYLVSDDMYWKLDENSTYVGYDYPRDMSIWRGVPVPLDAAFKYWDGKTYFFQGLSFWTFHDVRMRVERTSPHLISERWLKCSNAQTQNQPVPHQENTTKSAGSVGPSPLAVCLLFSVLLACSSGCRQSV